MSKGRVIQNIGLTTLVGISLTCDSYKNINSSLIKDQKSDIESILATPVDINNTTLWWTRTFLSDHTSWEIVDTILQWQTRDQYTIHHTDTINIGNIHTENNNIQTIEKWIDNNTVVWDISSNEHIKKILSIEECKNLCDKQIKQAIVEIIPSDAKKIKFDVSYMRRQAYNLFQHFFTIEDREDWIHIIFSKIKPDDKIFITQHMDNMKHHIKYDNNNGFWVKLLLTKWDLKDYIINGSEEYKEGEKSNIEKLYQIITNTWSIKYEWGESQFRKDVESVINLY